MTLRTSTNVLGLVLLLFSGFACALGLGEIKMNSSMNEPMDAEIAILNLGDLTENEVQVKLASAEDFQRAGVERIFGLVDLKFTLDLSNRARPLIRVSSQKSIKEPYLDFLIEMCWTSGRMLREYTVLMDLPVFAMEKPEGKKVSATRSSSSTAVPVPSSRDALEPLVAEPSTTIKPLAQAPVAAEEAVIEKTSAEEALAEKALAEEAAETAVPAPEPEPYTRPDSYTVGSGDTLWAIASRHRPEGATVQQTIVAIYENNPDAFIGNNANLVRKGAVLRLPDADAIQNVSHQTAVSTLKQQASTWQSDAPAMTPEATVEAVSDASVEQEIASPANTDSGRLRLSAGLEDGEGSSAGSEGGTGSGDGRELLENDLAITQEELERTTRENAELKQKLEMLEEQVDAMSRLVELEDSGLRGAQLTAESAEKLAEEPLDEAESEATGSFSFSDIVADDQTENETATEVSKITSSDSMLEEIDSDTLETDEGAGTDESFAAETAVSGDTTLEEVSDTEPVVIEPVAAPEAPVIEESLVAKLMGFAESVLERIKGLLLPIGAGLLVLVGLVVMLKRRRGSANETDIGMIEPDQVLADSITSPAAAESTPETASAAPLAEDDIELDAEDLLFAQAAQSLNEDVGDLDIDESEKVDAVGEAEIYLSLGNYETAAEILTKSLDRDPDDTAAHLKLLEIYSEQKDESAFDEQASKLQAVADASVLGEVKRMRAAAFGAVVESEPQADYIEMPDGDDFSFDLEDTAADTAVAELEAELDLPDLDLDLEMEEALEPEVAVESVAAESTVADESSITSSGGEDIEFDLDLDLDDLDLDSTADDLSADDLAADSSVASIDSTVAEAGLDLDLGEGFACLMIAMK